MGKSDKSYNLRIELDTKNCDLSAAEIEKLERGLDPLREPVREFPVSDLYITITYHPRSHQYRLKTSLVLTGRTIVTGDVDENWYAGVERCLRKLLKRVEEYKASLSDKEERVKHTKGTHHDVLPSSEPDVEQVIQAVENGDYAAFRRGTYMYEEAVRKRVGRWIERYPEVGAELGEEIQIADIVEEVFLNAFERFDKRPKDVRMGDWLEHLIDPSVKLLIQSPDEEMQSIQFARSLRDTEM